MRPITIAMGAKRPLAKEGGLLTWEHAIRSYIPGLCVFGNAVQNGTPTPATPITPQFVSGDLRVTGAEQTGGATFTLPTLRGIPLGSTIPASISANEEMLAGVWKDANNSYHIGDSVQNRAFVNGVWKKRSVQRIVVKVFDGAENFNAAGGYASGYRSFYWTIPSSVYSINAYQHQDMLMCTHLKPANRSLWSNPTSPSICLGVSSSTDLSIASKEIYLATSNAEKTDLKAWLAAQYAAGTPVTVYYLLAAPVVTLDDPAPIPSANGETDIYSTSAVPPHIRASVLVPRGVTA